jgi:hypothetical protein
MKRIALYIVLMVSCSEGFSQNVFNRIVEDTAAHIMNSVITLDTGYVFLSGTRNIYNIRSFSLTYVNELGEKQWENIYGDEQNETWEGLSGNLKINNDDSYLAGTIINSIENNWGISLTRFNAYDYSTYNHYTFLNDTIWKKAFNQVFSENKNYYIVGQIFNYEYGKYRLLLLKADSIGNILWNKSFGSVYESGDKVIFSNNELLIGGETKSFPGVSSPYQKWYLLKTDTAGNIIWERAYGRSNYNNGAVKGLIETADSNYLACGSYPVARYGGGGGEYLWDGCLRKIDTDGNLIWEKRYRFYSKISNPEMILIESSLNSIIEKDGTLFLLGNHRDHRGASRGYLQKITDDGSICWNRSYYPIDTTTTYQWLVSIQNTADNGFIMAGYGDEYDRQGIYPPQQAWLVKTDSLGIDGLCYTELPELNIDIALPTTLNCSDTITVYAYIAGKSAPYTIETSIGQNIDSIYYPPIFVPVEIGLTHVNLEWDNTTYFEQTITEATLSNHEWGQCIAKPIEFYTPHNAGWQQIQITVTDAYGETKTITKEVFVNDNCSNNITEENINGIYLYPNPIKDKLFIEYNFTSYSEEGNEDLLQTLGYKKHNDCRSGEISIYTIDGKMIISKTLEQPSGLESIDMKDYPPASYLIKITDCYGFFKEQKFVKQ